MARDTDQARQIQQVTGLQPGHFADLIRASQLMVDPSGGVAGRLVEVDWDSLGVPPGVVQNLIGLGTRYRYASPYVPIEEVWEQLSPETRNWFFENQNDLWRIEEAFPALDED